MKFNIYNNDCLEHLKEIVNDSVDSIITDPPYGIKFMSKGWDDDCPKTEIWQGCLRVLKPGGYALAFSGTRTIDLIMGRMREAGFEIRDTITWLYGSGFPKSHNISKAIDKKLGADLAKQWDGWGTALKPACEMIILARKPLSEKTVVDNVLKHGTGGLNIDECRVEVSKEDAAKIAKEFDRTYKDNGAHGWGGFTKDELIKAYNNSVEKSPNGETVKAVYKRYLKHSDTKRQAPDKPQGRFPANLILDEEAGAMLDEQSGVLKTNSTGGASRFFYCAKASKRERGVGNNHPTVKPQKLMQYLCKLITPPNGTILDCFMGSGSTGVAAVSLGFDFIGIEREKKYFEIAKKRIEDA